MNTFHQIMAGLNRPVHIYFVRHGESEGNTRGAMQGRRDSPLTEAGRQQAAATADWFRKLGEPLAAVFSSPLSRARETARIIAGANDGIGTAGEPEVLDGLLELETGIFTGLSFEEIRQRYPAEYAQFVVASWEAVPGAERTSSLAARALACWQSIVARANSSEAPAIVAVTHGGMLQWVLKSSFGAHPESPPPWMPLVRASNCGIFQFDARPIDGIDQAGTSVRWYYGQWSRMNCVPWESGSQPEAPRELFHTDHSQTDQLR